MIINSVLAGSGGGGGLVYETGTWSPEVDTDGGDFISFANQHDTPPCFFAIMADKEGEFIDQKTIAGYSYCTFHRLGLDGVNRNSSSIWYGDVETFLRGTGSSATVNGSHLLYDDDDTTQDTNAGAARYSDGFMYKADYTYKWIAIWPPTE